MKSTDLPRFEHGTPRDTDPIPRERDSTLGRRREGITRPRWRLRHNTASFALGWWEDFCRNEPTESVEIFSRVALDNLKGERPDIHWHAYDSDLALQTAAAAATLSGTQIKFLRYWLPEHEQTVGDILIAYKILNRSQPPEIAKTLARQHDQQIDAIAVAADLIDQKIRISLNIKRARSAVCFR